MLNPRLEMQDHVMKSGPVLDFVFLICIDSKWSAIDPDCNSRTGFRSQAFFVIFDFMNSDYSIIRFFLREEKK